MKKSKNTDSLALGCGVALIVVVLIGGIIYEVVKLMAWWKVASL
jgi:hypothetical protein